MRKRYYVLQRKTEISSFSMTRVWSMTRGWRFIFFIFYLLLFFPFFSFSQQGKTGALTVSGTIEVNEYTSITADVATGSTTIPVKSSTLNAHARFSGNLAAGDLIMIIQLQGAILNGGIDPFNANVGVPFDSTWGAVNNYNNCGNYEFAEVSSVPNATSIVVDCPLQYNYTDTGIVQIVRVPRYSSLTINSGGTIICDAWDSAIGGIVAIEVQSNTVINSGGSINATGLGFRGGVYHGEDSVGWGIGDVASRLQSFGKEKGESVGGYEWRYSPYGGKECDGAPGNAGGGGTAQNAGGGGGANGGIVADYINGYGNPDVSIANYKTAWALEWSWLPTFTSAGGGRGGYTFSSNTENPLTVGPGNTKWGGDNRRIVYGKGGRPMDYSTGKIFMAGGGGAGDQNDDCGGVGGAGGGIVFLMNYGTVSGAGTIITNGAAGQNTSNPNHLSTGGIDGAGGAGGGGTIIINSVGNISGISLTANGGVGGSQVLTGNTLTDHEAEGPGGGGSGGYIATSNGGLTETATGGANGTTNAPTMASFPPNGATIGGAGTINATITNFYIVAVNDTICSGQSASLSASLKGTVPGGTVIEWFSTQTGGTSIATGNTYVTPPLTNNTTYFIGTCPGSYRKAVTVVIGGSGTVTVSPAKTICAGASDTLLATGGTAYTWKPVASLKNPNSANPIASPSVTTTYSVSVTTSCGTFKDSVKITVNPLPIVTFTGNASICKGNSTSLTASGGTSYLWSNNATTAGITVTPATTTTYSVTVSNATCSKDTDITVTVNPIPSVTFSGITVICKGSSTSLTASGGTSYIWSNNATVSSIIVNPVSNTTYTVNVSNGTCSKDTSISVTVNPLPDVSITGANSICKGGLALLTAGGGTSYLWSNAATTSSIMVSPAITTTYTVTVGNGTCSKDTDITVTVANKLNVTITGNSPVCKGDSSTITVTGGSTYLWSNGATSSSIDVAPLIATTYSVSVSSGSCNMDTSFQVKVNPALSVTFSGNTNICKGTYTTLTSSGGTNYLWSNGFTTSSITVNPDSTSTYSVTVSNATCSKDTSIRITVNSSPLVTFAGNTTICTGSSTSLTASGGSNYIWSNAATTSSIILSPPATTTYSVSVSNGTCSKDTSITVTVSPYPAVTFTGDTSICSGSSTFLTASGGTSYLWSNASTTSAINITPAQTTTFTLSVSNGICATDTSITVRVNAIPNASIAGKDTICIGGSTSLTASGGTSYLWSNAATTSVISINPIANTTYSVTVSNGSCSSTTSTEIIVNALPNPSITGNTSICKGSSTVLTASGGTSFLWSNAATTDTITVSPASNTTYTITAIGNGCTNSATVTVTVNPTPTLSIAGKTSICKGSSTMLIASGGTSYLWSNSATTNAITIFPATTTTFTVTAYNGTCSTDSAITIVVNTPPVPSIKGITLICAGTQTALTASGGLTYLWSNSDTTATIDVAPTVSTEYGVIVSNGGCMAADSINIDVNPAPIETPLGDTAIEAGQYAHPRVQPDNLTYTYNWNPISSLSCNGCNDPVANPNQTTWYYVNITAHDGCSITDSILVSILEVGCGNVFVPTAFSPNGDGINDTLLVKGNCIAALTLEIFDRWGNKVFVSNELSKGWDGTYNGMQMNMGTYSYFLTATMNDGTIINKKGGVTLLR